MKTTAKLAVGLAIVAVVLGMGVRSHAAPIMLTFSGHLGGSESGSGVSNATTLGGVPLTQNTAFTFNAWFDTTTGFTSPYGDDLYPMTSFTMLIGETTYTGIPSANLNVMLSDPSVTGGWGWGYGVGIADANGSGDWYNADTHPNAIMYGYTVATPSLDTSAPTPTDFSSPHFFAYSTVINIPLVGVTGGLQLNDGANGYAVVYPQYDNTVTAALIPEPASMALFGLLGGAILLRRRLRK